MVQFATCFNVLAFKQGSHVSMKRLDLYIVASGSFNLSTLAVSGKKKELVQEFLCRKTLGHVITTFSAHSSRRSGLTLGGDSTRKVGALLEDVTSLSAGFDFPTSRVSYRRIWIQLAFFFHDCSLSLSCSCTVPVLCLLRGRLSSCV